MIILNSDRAVSYLKEHLLRLYGIAPEVQWVPEPEGANFGALVIRGQGGDCDTLQMIQHDLHQSSWFQFSAATCKTVATEADPLYLWQEAIPEPCMAFLIDLDRNTAIMNGEAA